MTLFLLIAATMIAIAVGCVLVPLLSRHARPGPAPEAANLAILRDQLAELEGDVARGVLDKERYEQARSELQRRALDEAQGHSTQAGSPRPANAWTAAVLAAGIPVGAVVFYLVVGSPSALLQQRDEGHQMTREKVEQMVARLANRLDKAPDDPEGWRVLGRSYSVMGRYPEAARAYERAAALIPADAGLLADYADALAMAQGRSMDGKPLDLVNRALKIDPDQWKALALAGTAALERKDYKQAIAFWERLRKVLPAGSGMEQSVEASIAEARALAGAGAAPRPKAAAAAKVAGKVSLAQGMAARAAPTDTVFIFARAANGPPMPLAVLRKQVRDLPLEFTLDDTMAMAPNLKLSDFPEVIVGARVSRSGSATTQSGDLRGQSKPVKIGTTGIAVVIDTAIP
ncbi:MAG: c-type cytochrome biogenesis protein CcmI [Burkholderiales bacterium]